MSVSLQSFDRGDGRRFGFAAPVSPESWLGYQRPVHHSSGEREVVNAIDQDARTGPSVISILVENQSPRSFQTNEADFIERQLRNRLGFIRVRVYAMPDCLNPGRNPRGALLHQHTCARLKRLFMHPHECGLQLRSDHRPASISTNPIAAADVQLVFKDERHRHWRECFL
jgi:hypothetical protein